MHPDTTLYWKIYPGSIVEAESTTTALASLIGSARGGGDSGEPPAKIMTIFEVVTALKAMGSDDRIVLSLLGPQLRRRLTRLSALVNSTESLLTSQQLPFQALQLRRLD